jgi:hypothetical protein
VRHSITLFAEEASAMKLSLIYLPVQDDLMLDQDPSNLGKPGPIFLLDLTAER